MLLNLGLQLVLAFFSGKLTAKTVFSGSAA